MPRIIMKQYVTVNIDVRRGPFFGLVATLGEAINAWLAITPAIAMDDDLVPRFSGLFVVTHRPTGKTIHYGAGCPDCCREVAKDFADLDWPNLPEVDDLRLRWLARQNRTAVDMNVICNLAVSAAKN